jgi:hypothetical protein
VSLLSGVRVRTARQKSNDFFKSNAISEKSYRISVRFLKLCRGKFLEESGEKGKLQRRKNQIIISLAPAAYV